MRQNVNNDVYTYMTAFIYKLCSFASKWATGTHFSQTPKGLKTTPSIEREEYKKEVDRVGKKDRHLNFYCLLCQKKKMLEQGVIFH